MPLWLRTVLRLTPIVFAASAAAVVGLIGFRALVPLDSIRGSSGELGNYLQTVGGIYAVLLAFVVYVVWGQFNDARGLVEREATALEDLHRTASGLPNGSRLAIQSGLRDYVDAVLRDEWVAMAKHDESAIERVSGKLDAVWLAIHSCRPSDPIQQMIYGEVLSRFNELTDLRTNRLTSARFRIPLTMKILLYSGAIIVTGSMYLIAIPQLWLHSLVTAALAGAVAHILYLIHDLDDAFDGDWQVARRPFERARTSFDRPCHQVDSADCA
ncbi:MAG TPA: DUF4239 domain-containing protein [Kofleriaceae bacterium]|nr:DUF4239 domain-containing protein [Kofleriaceae bacterium]